MTDRDILVALVVLACVALSFLFSGMETGVLALNRFRVRQRMRTGDRRAAVLHGFLENPEDFLWTILVGNTVVNFIIFSLWSIQLYYWMGDRPIWWALIFLLAVFVFYIACELAPKTLFQRYPDRLSLGLALPFRWIHRILAPLVAVAGWFSRGLLHWTGGKAFTGRLFGSREELRFIMQESALGLTSEEKTMINRVLDLPNLRVRHVMVPWAKTIRVEDSLPLAGVLAICRERGLTRIPVTDATTRRISGVINLEDILYLENLDPAKAAREYMQAAFFLPEELHLEEALRKMQQTGSRLAVVSGLDHRETGILSLQDILKVIFGEVTL
jgi:CBS domain containing-hemolysin-like protein